MFDRKDASSEIAAEFERLLIANAIQEETKALDEVEQAVELIDQAARIFERVGLVKEAEDATLMLEALAAKRKGKKKAKNKGKSVKEKDPATKGLTSEKMVENLKEKGWVFNADDNEADDGNGADDKPKSIEYYRRQAKYWRTQGEKAERQGKRSEADRCFHAEDECLFAIERIENPNVVDPLEDLGDESFDASDQNDMKLGISSGFHDVSSAAGYWRICAKDKLEKGDLSGAEKCLLKAIETSKLEDEAKKLDQSDENEVDDGEFWRKEAEKCRKKAANAQMAGKHQLAKHFHMEMEACLDKVEAMKKKDTLHADDNFVATFPMAARETEGPKFWKEKAEHWENVGRRAQKAGKLFEAENAFKRADECLHRAEKLGGRANDADDSFMFADDDWNTTYYPDPKPRSGEKGEVCSGKSSCHCVRCAIKRMKKLEHKHNDADDSFMFADDEPDLSTESPHWEKDEVEQDLSRGMHDLDLYEDDRGYDMFDLERNLNGLDFEDE